MHRQELKFDAYEKRSGRQTPGAEAIRVGFWTKITEALGSVRVRVTLGEQLAIFHPN